LDGTIGACFYMNETRQDETLFVGHEDFGRLTSDLLLHGTHVTFRAHGISMRPFIRPGDVLTVERIPAVALRPGDVVLTFRSDGQVLVHRLIRIEPSGDNPRYITRGDALIAEDPPVTAAEITGRVTAVERNGKPRPFNRGMNRMAGQIWMRFPILRRIYRRLAPASFRRK
jgi:signal peptidase